MTLRIIKFNRRIILIVVLLAVLLLMALPAMAQNNVDIRTGGQVSFGSNVSSVQRVTGDVVSIGGNVSLENGADGDVVSIGGNVDAKGTVNGDVVAIGGNATVAGNINGDVVAIDGKVILKGNSVINGDIVASSLERDDGVVINGNINQVPIPQMQLPNISQWAGTFLWLKLLYWIAILLLNFLVIAAYPDGVVRIAQSVEKDTLRVLGIGVIASILFLPVALTIIGIPVIAFLVIAAKLLGLAGVILLVGRKAMQAVKYNHQSLYLQALAGFVLIALIKLVPFLGFVAGIFLFWLSLGAMLDTKFGTGRLWFRKASY